MPEADAWPCFRIDTEQLAIKIDLKVFCDICEMTMKDLMEAMALSASRRYRQCGCNCVLPDPPVTPPLVVACRIELNERHRTSTHESAVVSHSSCGMRWPV
jgi:hypothetical protein